MVDSNGFRKMLERVSGLALIDDDTDGEDDGQWASRCLDVHKRSKACTARQLPRR